MDEPFGALDAQTRLMTQELRLTIWEELRPTIVFVTHDIDEALFLGSRIGILSRRPGYTKLELEVPIRPPTKYGSIDYAGFRRIEGATAPRTSP